MSSVDDLRTAIQSVLSEKWVEGVLGRGQGTVTRARQYLHGLASSMAGRAGLPARIDLALWRVAAADPDDPSFDRQVVDLWESLTGSEEPLPPSLRLATLENEVEERAALLVQPGSQAPEVALTELARLVGEAGRVAIRAELDLPIVCASLFSLFDSPESMPLREDVAGAYERVRSDGIRPHRVTLPKT